MVKQLNVSEEVREEIEKTVESLRSIGREKGISVRELKEKHLD